MSRSGGSGFPDGVEIVTADCTDGGYVPRLNYPVLSLTLTVGRF